MKTQNVLLAIQALQAAAKALRSGMATVHEQMRIASACSAAEINLELDLLRDCPELKVEKKAA